MSILDTNWIYSVVTACTMTPTIKDLLICDNVGIFEPTLQSYYLSFDRVDRHLDWLWISR